MKNCFKISIFFCILYCQNIANTSVFGWFALVAGSHTSEENTGICVTIKVLVEEAAWAQSVSPRGLRWLRWLTQATLVNAD